MRRAAALVAGMALVAAACGSLETGADPGSGGPGTTTGTTPIATTSPPIATARLSIEDAAFTLEDDGECLTLTAEADGYSPSVEVRCTDQAYSLHESNDCFDPEPVAGFARYDSVTTVPCAHRVPHVLWGRTAAPIAHLCIARFADQSIDGVWFTGPGAGGLVLAPVPDGTRPGVIPYTSSGTMWGEPPFDQPFSVVSAMCSAEGPWASPPPEPVDAFVIIEPDTTFLGMTAALNAGTGPMRVQFGEAQIELPLPLYPDTREIVVSLGPAEGPPAHTTTVRLPDALVAELAIGGTCPGTPLLVVNLGPGTGGSPAITLDAFIGSGAAMIWPDYPDTGSDRSLGEPCDGATGATTTTGATITRVLEGFYRLDVAPEVLELGPRYLVGIFDADSSGYVLDMGHLSAHPDEEYGTYLFPGTVLRIGLLLTDEDPEVYDVEVPMPPLPVDAEAPFVLMIEITGFAGNSGGEPSLGPADVTVRWRRS